MTAVDVEVVIVGAGPAGISAALHLAKIDPSWTERMVVLDRAAFPREKLCGGAITGDHYETALGIPLDIVPTFVAKGAYLISDQTARVIDARMRIVRRAEFDAAVVKLAESRGIRIRQNEDVLDVSVEEDCVVLTLESGTIRARALIAADGAKSVIRRKLKWPGGSHVARVIEIITPENPEGAPTDPMDESALDANGLFRNQMATFDFRVSSEGVQGYYWDFPSFVGGKPFMNRGIGDVRADPSKPLAHLPPILKECLDDRGVEMPELHGHPIRWYHPDETYSRPRVLLAGDAAGVDPLVGEGILFAYAYGELTAAMIDEGHRNGGTYDFATYDQRIRAHDVLGKLTGNYALAKRIYGSRWPGRLLVRACLH